MHTFGAERYTYLHIQGVAKKLFYSKKTIIVVSKPLTPCSRKEPVGGNWGTHLIRKAQVLTNNGPGFPTFGFHYEFDVWGTKRRSHHEIRISEKTAPLFVSTCTFLITWVLQFPSTGSFREQGFKDRFAALTLNLQKMKWSAELSWSLIIMSYRPIARNNAFTLNSSWPNDSNEGVGFWFIWGFLLRGDFLPRQVKKGFSSAFFRGFSLWVVTLRADKEA